MGTTEEIEQKIDAGDVAIFSSEIIKLEKSIREVHEMFLDVSNLVQMQGEMITRIEDHVNSAVIDVERGREDLGKAEKFKKAATKKKFILLAILVVVVLIILLVILSEFGAFSSSGSSETIIKHEYIYNFANGSKVVRDKEDPTLVKENTVTLGTSEPPPLPDLDYEGPGK